MPNPNEYLAQLASLAQQVADNAKWFQEERAKEIERLRGIKVIRLPIMSKLGTNPFTITPDQSQQFGGPQTPDQGYIWSLKHLVIEGMTRTATPDIIQITRQGRVIWELNGNQYAQTFGRGEIILFHGEALGYTSVGTFASTANIVIHGMAWEVPAPEIGKLI